MIKDASGIYTWNVYGFERDVPAVSGSTQPLELFLILKGTNIKYRRT